MARLPRLSLPGVAHHLSQRGNNQQPIFGEPVDYELMRSLLVEQCREAGVTLHAYVLLPTELHLLATPANGDSLARMMQGIGRRYVRHFNRRAGRSGTLWEGRYRCAPLQAERFLLAFMAWMDRLPVQAGLATEPAHWAPSSHRHYVGQAQDRAVSPHPLYWALGNTPFAREQAYAERVGQGLTSELQRQLLDSTQYGWALGDEAFLAELQKRTDRRVTRGRPGRPRAPAAK